MKKSRAVGLTTRLRGVLIPTGWDESGHPVELALADYSEREYRIAPTNKLTTLTGFLRREVDVTGTMTRDHQGRLLLEVHSCEPVLRSA